jgi:hypothetical protein
MNKNPYIGSRVTAEEVFCFPSKVPLIIYRSQPNIQIGIKCNACAENAIYEVSGNPYKGTMES